MKNSSIILIWLFSGLLMSCTESPQYIITTDIEKIFAGAVKNGLTEEESEKLSILMVDTVKQNTIGKKIPKITVTNPTGKTFNLPDEITENSLIISSDVHCGFGFECMLNTFPDANKKLTADSYVIPTICLLKKTGSDLKDPEKFDWALKKLNLSYKKIYIIDEQEAYKINLIGNPVRLFVNEDKIITNMIIGNCTADNLYKEVKQNLSN